MSNTRRICKRPWIRGRNSKLTSSRTAALIICLRFTRWARLWRLGAGSDIARRLNITRGSVSINLRTLKKRGWVQTDEHRLVKLSANGLKAAHSVMAKRVIVKTFLCDVLDIPEPQADIDSCKIEHLISHSTGQRLVRFPHS